MKKSACVRGGHGSDRRGNSGITWKSNSLCGASSSLEKMLLASYSSNEKLEAMMIVLNTLGSESSHY